MSAVALTFKKRDARTTQHQYEMMLDFMLDHPDIASGRHASTKKVTYEKLWEELAHKLNSDTAGPSKATAKWMKCWSDWKHNTRTKSTKIKQYEQLHNDGKYPCLLTSLEERLLKLMSTFKNDGLGDGLNHWKQDNNFSGKREYGEYESQFVNWNSVNSNNNEPSVKQEQDEKDDADEDSSNPDEESSYNNVADFCIPVITQGDGEVSIYPANNNNIQPGNWKKRKRIDYEEETFSPSLKITRQSSAPPSNTSSPIPASINNNSVSNNSNLIITNMNKDESSKQSTTITPQQLTQATIAQAHLFAQAHLNAITNNNNNTFSTNNNYKSATMANATNTPPTNTPNTSTSSTNCQSHVNNIMDTNVSIKEALERIATAAERSAIANESCAQACKKLTHLYERVASACERSAEANELASVANQRSADAQERILDSSEKMHDVIERQTLACEHLVKMVKEITAQSVEFVKKFISNTSADSR